jgi:hypothetical protein
MDSKKWWTSRTLWANTLAVIAGIVQGATGQAWINAEIQVGILALVNMILRVVTKQPLS